MLKLNTLILCGVLWLSASPAAAASACFNPDETTTVQIRQLHLRLQVAALKCNDPAWGFRDRYNSYVSKFGASLSSNAKSLRAALGRTGMARTETQFDRFITCTANDISLRAQNSAEYCQQHLSLLDEVLSSRPDALPHFAAMHEPAPAESCARARVVQRQK